MPHSPFTYLLPVLLLFGSNLFMAAGCPAAARRPAAGNGIDDIFG